MRAIKLWFARNFLILTIDEATQLNLKFRNHVLVNKELMGISIWVDEIGRQYKVEMYVG